MRHMDMVACVFCLCPLARLGTPVLNLCKQLVHQSVIVARVCGRIGPIVEQRALCARMRRLPSRSIRARGCEFVGTLAHYSAQPVKLGALCCFLETCTLVHTLRAQHSWLSLGDARESAIRTSSSAA